MDTSKIIEALKKLDIPEYRHFDDEDKENGYRQMCQDLKDLAEKDGCIGAAFALSVFSAIASEKVDKFVKESLSSQLFINGNLVNIELCCRLNDVPFWGIIESVQGLNSFGQPDDRWMSKKDGKFYLVNYPPDDDDTDNFRELFLWGNPKEAFDFAQSAITINHTLKTP